MLERHITDPVADVHANAVHARLKRKSMSIAQGRGTMSMPTSPLRTGVSWDDGPFPWNEGVGPITK